MEQHIGKNIQTLRKERGVSQGDLAAALGVTVQAVSKWETGKANPDLFQLPRLADYFRVSIDRLFGRESPAPPRRRARIQPLISVLIPVYQVEEYLRRCLDSVLAQTYPNLEILLVDDGSTDHSPVICQEYMEKAKVPVRFWRTEHRGVAHARQILMDEAKGDYCFFLDSDDFIDPHTIEILYKLATENNADIVQCRMQHNTTGVQGEPEKIVFDGGNTLVYSGNKLLDNLACAPHGANLSIMGMMAAKLYRREVFRDIHLPEGKIHEVEYAMHRLVGNSEIIVCTDLPLYYYFRNPNSLTRRAFNHSRYDALDALRDRIDFCRERGRDFAADMTCLRYCSQCARLYQRTAREISSQDPALPILQEKYNAMSDYLLKTDRMDEKINDLLKRSQTDLLNAKFPRFWDIALYYYQKEYGEALQ